MVSKTAIPPSQYQHFYWAGWLRDFQNDNQIKGLSSQRLYHLYVVSSTLSSFLPLSLCPLGFNHLLQPLALIIANILKSCSELLHVCAPLCSCVSTICVHNKLLCPLRYASLPYYIRLKDLGARLKAILKTCVLTRTH